MFLSDLFDITPLFEGYVINNHPFLKLSFILFFFTPKSGIFHHFVSLPGGHVDDSSIRTCLECPRAIQTLGTWDFLSLAGTGRAATVNHLLRLSQTLGCSLAAWLGVFSAVQCRFCSFWHSVGIYWLLFSDVTNFHYFPYIWSGIFFLPFFFPFFLPPPSFPPSLSPSLPFFFPSFQVAKAWNKLAEELT